MLSESGRRPMLGGSEGLMGDELKKEIEFLLPEQRRQEIDDLERELNLYRSGSAPPTVEGSFNAVGGLFSSSIGGANINPLEFSGANEFASEEELRSDPAYLSYYYSNVNLNPRLPPPMLSKEDWRFAQRLKGGSSALGGIGDRRKVYKVDDGPGRSLLSMPPGFNSKNHEIEAELDNSRGSEWEGGDVLGLGLGSKQKSLADIFQDELSRASPITGLPPRPASRSTLIENPENVGLNDDLMRHDLTCSDSFRSSANSHGSSAVQIIGQHSSYTYAAALGASLSRSDTPDPQLVTRAPSPCPTPIGGGRVGKMEKKIIASPNLFNGISSNLNEVVGVVASLSELTLSKNGGIGDETHSSPQMELDVDNYQSYLFGLKGSHDGIDQTSFAKKLESGRASRSSVKASFSDLAKSNGGPADLTSSSNSYLKGSPTSSSTLNDGAHYQHIDDHGNNATLLNYGSSWYSMNPTTPAVIAGQPGNGNVPLMFENVAATSRLLGGLVSDTNKAESHNAGRIGNLLAANALQVPLFDPMYFHYLQTSDYAAVPTINDPYIDRNYASNSYMSLLELQKGYLGALLSPQKSHYGVPFSNKSSSSNHHGHYGNPAFGVGVAYPGSPVLSNSPLGPGSPMRQNEINARFSGMRNLGVGTMGPWQQCAMDGTFGSSLLEEFKSNKTRFFELSEISGHVVEFSTDQYGSRFIQQKLETATTDEKNMVYQEILPRALALMTDVFGNYVIQKFFEHGLPVQKRELANKLFGHVLALSLQMYGCRVIQKAIEVVDLDQKIKMVEELDGHVMRCVRDQNGNHVIQKCIECVPEDAIRFIVSTFFDQVVTLSSHPYGCRVIQRVLEHCNDSKTQTKVMDEILGAISMLAQDQYGNYVVQHVLEHGKLDERSHIIKELAGKIVQMSQQKFASNVVEKCLTFSGLAERQLLVNEMLGTTDENEPLQAMMKDQFANYVVQKVLETCDDQQRALILTRIKVHLNALKKYTYGKHIVARVEKLVAAGERRIAAQSLHLVA